MVMRGGSSLGEVAFGKHHHHHQYASTPHLFVFQSHDDSDDDSDTIENSSNSDGSQRSSSKEPIYSSTLVVRKENALRENNAIRNITEKYDTLGGRLTQYRESYDDPLAVTEDDVARIETFFKGHLTQVWVSRTMANLYSGISTSESETSWQLKFTGVPLLLLDAGETKSRSKRRLQLIVAEKGTGFALWKDVVDNLTSYKVQEPHFHTLFLSSDHREKLGLSFNDANIAMKFHSILEELISDPANISLSGPGKKKKEKPKEKVPKYKPPKKADISRPCNFNHVTNVDPTDKTRFFSLQLFSRKPTTDPIQPHASIEKITPVETEAVMKQKVIQV